MSAEGRRRWGAGILSKHGAAPDQQEQESQGQVKGTGIAIRQVLALNSCGIHFPSDLDCLESAAEFWLMIGSSSDRPKISL